MKVNEIFYSIQGEGFHTGRPAIFVRLAECNLSCQFCDTEFNLFTEMSEMDILVEMQKLSLECRFVVLTGGEPTMHNLDLLLLTLQTAGYYTAIETNGMFKLSASELKNLDWITFSPKVKDMRTIKLSYYDEIKIVVPNGGGLPYIGPDWQEYKYGFLPPLEKLSGHHLWASPMNFGARHRDNGEGITMPGEQTCSDTDGDALDWCLMIIKERPAWKLNLQLHKIIGER